jgi:hypothetical protein
VSATGAHQCRYAYSTPPADTGRSVGRHEQAECHRM